MTVQNVFNKINYLFKRYKKKKNKNKTNIIQMELLNIKTS